MRQRPRTARVFGWLSGSLGVAALLAPRTLTRAAGIEPTDRTSAIMRGIGVLDLIAGLRLQRTATRDTSEGRTLYDRTAITVRRPPHEAYRSWREFASEWDAEIVEDRAGELIAWRSVEGATVPNSGTVQFVPAPGDQGTEVVVELSYDLPGGVVGEAAAKLSGDDPAQQLRDELRRFKQVLETGEVVVSDGTPEGTRTQRLFNQRPGRPLRTNGARR